MLEALKAILLWMFYLPALYMTGSIFDRWISERETLLKGIFYYALGLGLWGTWIILIGTIGQLNLWTAYAGILCFSLLGFRSLREFPDWLRSIFNLAFQTPTNTFGQVTRVIFASSILLSFLVCFAPEIANDSLAYHLYLPKVFIKNHSILPLFFDEKSWRSLFMEEIFILPLFLKSVSAAILFHWVTTLLLVITLIRVLQKETNHYEVALFLGAAFWLTPTLFNQVSISYSDGGVAFFAFLGFLLFMKARAPFSPRDYFLSGILFGISVSCKWLTLQFVFACFLWLGLDAFLNKKWKENSKALCFLSAGLFLAASYWFLRNTLLTGSPLYPLFTNKFGSAGLYTEQGFAKIGIQKNVLNFFLLPFYTSFSPNPFNRHHWVGPLYFLFVYSAFWGAVKNPKARPYFFTSFVVTGLWFLMGQDIRFLLPAFPLMFISCGYGYTKLKTDLALFSSKIILTAFLLALSGYLALGIYHYRAHITHVFQNEPSENFIHKYERSFDISECVNKNLPDNARIFNANEVRKFYFDRDLIDSWMFYRIYRTRPDWSKATLITLLKKEGITHILRNALKDSTQSDAALYPFLDEVLQDPSQAELLFQSNSQNIREPQYHYAIYRLK